jgi:peptidoglycan hydrolase CwlO-like protein
LQIKTTKFITIIFITAIIFFLIGFITFYFSSRIQIRSLSDRVAEYNRLCEQYKIREQELKRTIDQLRIDARTESEFAQKTREEIKRIQSINRELNNKIEQLRKYIESSVQSSNRIDEYSDGIIEIIRRIQERGTKKD